MNYPSIADRRGCYVHVSAKHVKIRVRVFVEGSILSCTYVGKMCCDNEYSHKLVLQAQHSLTLAAHYFNKPLLASR